MTPKIVLIIPGKANPHRLNGVNKVVYSVAQEIHNAGNPVDVWGISADTKVETSYPFPLTLFQGSVRSFCLPEGFQDAITAQPAGTIFHLHGVMNPLYFTLARYFKAQGLPYVVTPHGALLKRSLRRGFWYKYLYLILFEKNVLRNAKAIHCITDKEKSDLKKWCKPSRIKIIPNGTVIQKKHKRPHAKHEEPIFLFMGRFDIQHKGIDLVLAAFAAYHQKAHKGQLILVGRGYDEDWIKARIRELHLSHKIRILPPQFDQDKDDLLARVDIFVHPSRWDVLPTSTLEAAAAGLPLIISKASGFGSKIHNYHAGWTTYTDHTSELAQKFLLAYKRWMQGKTIEIGRNAQKMIADHFLWSKIVPDYYEKLYD
ncbi:MAG TPA: glycosyltransferase family 4 protein [Alphaproteobacteria bacterium]